MSKKFWIPISILIALILLISIHIILTPHNADSHKALVLMYHDIREYSVEGNPSIISREAFRSQLETLQAQGYQAVTFDDLIAFVHYGASLPERAVVITFDDGYLSNLELAAPILAEFGMTATINIIGIQMGSSVYRNTDIPTIPRFSFEQVLPWFESGVIQIGHHSFDMHEEEWIEPPETFRRGVLRRDGESEAEWRATFIRDFELLQEDIYNNLGITANVFAYPYGLYNRATEEMLRELGVRVTLTTNPGINLIEPGNPNSLFALNRINMEEDMVGERLVEYLDSFWNRRGLLW